MKNTITVLFVLAMIIASTQTFRHVYVKWVKPDTSVLDEFKDKVESSIKSAETLSALVVLYREANLNVKNYEADKNNTEIEYRQQRHKEPYKTKLKITEEIDKREYDKNQLFKLNFFWTAGLLSLSIGVFTFRKFNKWLGLSGIIIGFSEMLCWTSPLFHNRVMSENFVLLLNLKLTYSVITLLILISFWLLLEKGKVLKEIG